MLPSSVHQLLVGNSNPTPKIYTQTRDKRHNRLSLVCVCPDVLVSVRIALSLFPLFPSPAATQVFSLFPLRRVQQFVVSASFPAATQVYSAFCLRRLLVPFRLCPSPSACSLLLPRRKVFRCFACVVGEAGVRNGSIHISRVESVSETHDAHFWCYSEWCGTDEEQPLCRVVWNHDEESAVSYGLHELVPCQDKV